jgi:hypothetical protein
MKQTAVEWLESRFLQTEGNLYAEDFTKAKEMEKNQKLKYQLFIGKVSEIIGDKKTIELLRECNETFKSE